MYLEEMNEEIKSRILEKGFCNKSQDVPKKKTPLCLHRAMGKLVAHGKKGKAEDRIAEELVDVILYILDSSSFCMPNRQHG
jgi:hypothetical protein